MKKAKKAVIAALAAATLTMSALGLAACSKKGDGSTPDGGGNDTYTVTFKVNEGAWNAEGTEVADKTRTTGTDGKVAQADWPTNPSREDYTFAGWYVNAEGTGVSYTFASTFSSDQTLYAKWTSNEVPTTYTVTLDPGEGTLAETTVTTGADGKLATLPTPTAPANKTFSGWFTAATGGTQVTTDTVFNNNTTTIYAQYTDNGGSSTTYTVTLDPGAGTLAGGTTVTTGTDGKIAALPTPTAPANKTFKGWFTAATGGTQVTNDTVFSNNTTTIYAQYTDNGQAGTTYTVTLNAYGGTLAGEATATTGTDGKFATLPAAPTAPEGGEFKGWYTAATGGTQITTATVFNNNTTTIYARYTMANPPAAEFGTAVIKANDTAMTSNTANINRDYIMPESGEPYFDNSTKSDEFMLAEQTFDSQTVLHITINNETIDDFWCEAAEGVRVSEKNSNTNKVTVSAGTYSFYLQKYADGGWTMWVAGTSQSGGGGDEADVDDGLYIVGAHNNWIPTANDKGDGPTALYEQDGTTKYGDEYKFTVTFSASPEAPIMDFKIATYESNAAKLDGWHCKLQNDIPESVATGGGVGNDAPNIKVIEAGSYEVYLKVYVNGGSDIWLGKVVGSKTITLNANGGTLAGAATVTTDQFGKLTALPAEPTAPTGKRFDGWYTAATGGTKIAAGAAFTENATIYAQYVDASVKADGVYNGDAKLTATVKVNPEKDYELMITGLTLTEQTTVTIYRNGAIAEIDTTKSGASDTNAVTFNSGNTVTLAAGTYDMYYTFGSTHTDYKKLWVTKKVEGPATDKNASLTYQKNIGATGVYLVGKFYSRGMDSYAWGDGYVMPETTTSGVYEIKNIYLYEGDSIKARRGSNDTDGQSVWKQETGVYNWNGGNCNIEKEGYFTVQFKPNGSNFELVVTYVGLTPAA